MRHRIFSHSYGENDAKLKQVPSKFSLGLGEQERIDIMSTNFSLNLAADKQLHDVSDMLFGIFFEDINFACDGGLNANMVNNSTFDGIYLSKKGYNQPIAILFKPEPHDVIDRLRYW